MAKFSLLSSKQEVSKPGVEYEEPELLIWELKESLGWVGESAASASGTALSRPPWRGRVGYDACLVSPVIAKRKSETSVSETTRTSRSDDIDKGRKFVLSVYISARGSKLTPHTKEVGEESRE